MKVGLVLLLAGSLVLSAACGGDDEKVAPGPEDSGGAPADAGAPPVGTAGTTARPGGSGGGGAGGTGGSNSSAGAGGGEPTAGGAGGATSAAGAAGQGGAVTEPTEPGLSLCGVDKYETGEGCAECPAAPSEPVSVSCQDYVSAAKVEEDLTLGLRLPFHEVLSAQVSIAWRDSTDVTPSGMADVSFSYSPSSNLLSFDLPLEARYADVWEFGTWKLEDACGFVFDASNLTISYDGQTYRCSDPK
jgi:hypothetical protein